MHFFSAEKIKCWQYCSLRLRRPRELKMNIYRQLSKPIIGYVRCGSLHPSRRVFSSTESDEPVFDMENPYQKEKAQCILCRLKITPDYKNVKLLSQFQSPYTGRVYGRHITGLCQQQQVRVEQEIVKSQNAALMPTYFKDPVFFDDPKLFDSERPLRPHRF